jgi:protein-S-isoprenylcysteine O-methyltransferase Ste14
MLTLIFTIHSLLTTLFQIHTTEYLIWCIPYLLSSSAILFFLIITLFKNPKDINESLPMYFIAVISANLPFFIAFNGNVFPMGVKNLLLIEIAKYINLLIIPLYLWGLFTLGKRLTILPEANSLQTGGAYRFFRHPLYVTYIYWYLIQTLTFQTWLVLVLSIVQISLIIIRAKYEEKILMKNFPEYKEYMTRVWWINYQRYWKSV